ncbi:MAG: hypothetical protein AABY32_06665 [Nanoarchaeota archaeon]
MFFQAKSKKGVSVIIGYVLLITFAVIIGVIVYQWMKTYVPQEDLNCPDGVSIFIDDYSCSSNTLVLHFKNNGRFNIGGYFIHATDSPEEELATIDLSKNNTDINAKISSGIRFGIIGTELNSLKPNDEETDTYDLTGIENIYSVDILPIRWQKQKNRNVLVSCKDTKITEIIKCNVAGEGCIPENTETTCGIAVCGTKINNCLLEVNCPPGCGIYTCVEGQCTTSICDSAPDPTLLGVCGSAICGFFPNGTCDAVSCGACPIVDHATSVCSTGSCILSCNVGWCNSDGNDVNGCEAPLGTPENCGTCGNACTPSFNCVDGVCNSCNGTWISPETSGVECDGTPRPANCSATCVCTGGYVSNGIGGCKLPSSVNSCGSYCDFLGYNGLPSAGSCQQNQAQCNSYCNLDGVLEPGGNQFGCTIPMDKCCCCLPKI